AQRLARLEARRLPDPVALVARPETAGALGDVAVGQRGATRDGPQPDHGPARLAVLGVDVDAGHAADRAVADAVDPHPHPVLGLVEARQLRLGRPLSHPGVPAARSRRWRDRARAARLARAAPLPPGPRPSWPRAFGASWPLPAPAPRCAGCARAAP